MKLMRMCEVSTATIEESRLDELVEKIQKKNQK